MLHPITKRETAVKQAKDALPHPVPHCGDCQNRLKLHLISRCGTVKTSTIVLPHLIYNANIV